MGREELLQARDKVKKVLTQDMITARNVKQFRRSVVEQIIEGAKSFVTNFACNGFRRVDRISL